MTYKQTPREKAHKNCVVIALGGNALLQRGEPLEEHLQRKNTAHAAKLIAEVADNHQVVLTHGNGPQVELLALQNESYKDVSPYPLDILNAETVGMIGYLLVQELKNNLPNKEVVALLTQTIVDKHDQAFQNPTKFVGPIYEQSQALKLSQKKGWKIKRDGAYFRRVVPSPIPKEIVELAVIQYLLERDDLLLICLNILWDTREL